MTINTVSVVIAAFNAAEFLKRSVESVLNQTRGADEILVIDDCSADSTAHVVRKLAEKNPIIRLIRLEQNGGPARARNIGFEHATGTFVAILDADDAWKADRLARLMSLAEEMQADFVADNQILFDSVANREVRHGLSVSWSLQDLTPEVLFANDLIEVGQFDYGLLKPLIRKQFLVDRNLVYDESLRCGEDFALYAEMLFQGAKAVLTSEAFYIYSTRIGAISNKPSPGSQTVPRFDVLVNSQDRIAIRYKDHLTPAILRAMLRRRKQLLSIHYSNQARLIRHRREYASFAVFTVTHPSLLALYVRRTAKRLRRQLRFVRFGA